MSRRCFCSRTSKIGHSIRKCVFEKYLLLTNMIAAGLLMIVGDIGSQALERTQYGRVNKPIDLNVARVGWWFKCIQSNRKN